jgi:hypothetical protein
MNFTSYLKDVFKTHAIEDGNAVRLLKWRQSEILKKAKEQEDEINRLTTLVKGLKELIPVDLTDDDGFF